MRKSIREDIAKRYYNFYLSLKDAFKRVKVAAESESLAGLNFEVEKLNELYNKFLGVHETLYNLHLGVKVNKEGEAEIIDFHKLDGEEMTKALVEFYSEKIIIEKEDNNG